MVDRTERVRRLAALGERVRLAIVDELASGDRSPGELRRRLELESNLLAHHLDVLEGAGIVARTRSDGDRWNTLRCRTFGSRSGTICMPLAPVPTTATFLSDRSSDVSNWLVWKIGPAKSCMPGNCGIAGRSRNPTALMMALAYSVFSTPALRLRISHIALSSIQRRLSTSVPNRMKRRTSNRSASQLQ